MRPPVAHVAPPPLPLFFLSLLSFCLGIVIALGYSCGCWLENSKLQAGFHSLSLSLSGSISASIKVKRRPSAEWGQFVSLHSFTHSLTHFLTHSVSQWGSHAVSWSSFRSVRLVSHWVSKSSRRRRRRAGDGELGTQQRWKWKLRALYNFFFLWLIALS